MAIFKNLRVQTRWISNKPCDSYQQSYVSLFWSRVVEI